MPSAPYPNPQSTQASLPRRRCEAWHHAWQPARGKPAVLSRFWPRFSKMSGGTSLPLLICKCCFWLEAAGAEGAGARCGAGPAHKGGLVLLGPTPRPPGCPGRAAETQGSHVGSWQTSAGLFRLITHPTKLFLPRSV